MTQLMTRTEQSLYPKISSIYNKIMQLAIAIFLIIVLMNLWVFSYGNNQQSTKKHFNVVSEQYLSQITTATQILLASKHGNGRAELQQYYAEITENTWIKEISYYDKTGMLLIASKDHSSMNDLFGISINKANRSKKYSTFVQEVTLEKLHGYVRLTVENHSLTKDLEATSAEQYDLVRLMMILAVVVGFFLTRGLNRFSRQGFRLG